MTTIEGVSAALPSCRRAAAYNTVKACAHVPFAHTRVHGPNDSCGALARRVEDRLQQVPLLIGQITGYGMPRTVTTRLVQRIGTHPSQSRKAAA